MDLLANIFTVLLFHNSGSTDGVLKSAEVGKSRDEKPVVQLLCALIDGGDDELE